MRFSLYDTEYLADARGPGGQTKMHYDHVVVHFNKEPILGSFSGARHAHRRHEQRRDRRREHKNRARSSRGHNVRAHSNHARNTQDQTQTRN